MSVSSFVSVARWVQAVLVFLALVMLSAPAWSNSTKGDRFVVTFAPNNSSPTLLLFVSADSDTTGQAVHPGGTIDFTVSAGDVETVTIPATPFQGQTKNAAGTASIVVTTDNPVTLYGLNKVSATTDGYLAIPEAGLGTRYYLVSPTDEANVYGSYQAVIVATEDGTTVTLNLTAAAGSCAVGTDCTVALDAGDTYYVATGSTLTGSLVTSDKPIGVISGGQCVNLGAGACDHITEMLPPTSKWSTDFLAVRFRKDIGAGARYVDEISVLASEDGTVVTIDGTQVATLNAGEDYHADLPASSTSTKVNEGYYIKGTKPILVTQFMEHGTYRNASNQTTTGDPAMVVLPSYQQYLPSYSFATMADGFLFDAVNVAIPTAAQNTLILDGVKVSASAFEPIGDSGFSSAQLVISPGTHTISASQPFGIVIYGANSADSYAAAGGFSTASVADVDGIAPPGGGTDIEALSGGSNESCFPIKAEDANGDPVAGIRVDAEMSGANAGTAFAFTGSDGVAEVCFPGTEDGESDVVFTVGTKDFQGTVTWVGCATECGVDGQTERAATRPNPPTGLSAAKDNTTVNVSFTPGSDGGEPITNYAYSLDGQTYTPLDPADGTSPITISGLQLGTPYSIRLKAINSVGESDPSDPVFITLDGSTDGIVDSDGDGVADDADDCANTPSGATVDANGCSAAQLDADGDGVSDDADDCANTPSGATVDANGCSAAQLDADGDGVNDDLDECASTPSGESVNAVGCSLSQLDTDSDGVSDALDQCANTPSGQTPNAVGCALSQLDTDNDGVSDDIDQCAASPAGQDVTEFGCEVIPVPTLHVGALMVLMLTLFVFGVMRLNP